MLFLGSNQKLSSLAMDILDQILSSQETHEGKGMIVIHGRPSNNVGTACVFSFRGGTTVGYKREDFAVALAELIRAGFIMELDREATQTRYKLHRTVTENALPEPTQSRLAEQKLGMIFTDFDYSSSCGHIVSTVIKLALSGKPPRNFYYFTYSCQTASGPTIQKKLITQKRIRLRTIAAEMLPRTTAGLRKKAAVNRFERIT
jgi:hypothetical protein